jgi:hypothetical protein
MKFPKRRLSDNAANASLAKPSTAAGGADAGLLNNHPKSAGT